MNDSSRKIASLKAHGHCLFRLRELAQLLALTVAAIFMVLGCSKEKQAAPEVKAPLDLIEPGAAVGAVQKGMNKEHVEAALGKPDKINSKWWFYLNRGIVVAFGDTGVLFNIKCFGLFAGVTKEGIGIGSTRAELIAAFGNPSSEKQLQGKESGAVIPGSTDPGATYEDLWFAAQRISFNLQNDKVTSFIVHL